MTPKRQQNSILVLATLGVYLGLVLAGATPQILAHSAMTRQFDVKDEIEFREDLDTKPDSNADVKVVEEINSLVSSLNYWVTEDKFSWSYPLDLRIDDLSFDKNGHPAFLGTGDLDTPHGRLFDGFSKRIARSVLSYNPRCPEEQECSRLKNVSTRLKSDGKSITLSVIVNGYDDAATQDFAANLDRNLVAFRTSTKSTTSALIAENTTSKVDGFDTILVTNLPRAGLDALLATNAK